MKDSVHPEPSQQSAIPALGSEASRSIPIPSNSIAIGRQQIRRADEDPVFLYHNKEAASPKADSLYLFVLSFYANHRSREKGMPQSQNKVERFLFLYNRLNMGNAFICLFRPGLWLSSPRKNSFLRLGGVYS